MSTYTPIASVTLSSAQSSVTFSGIPQTYTDLVLVTSVKYTSSTSHINLRYNGDTNNNYSNTVIYGDGTSAVSGRDSNVSFCAIGRGGTEYGVGRTHIQNYTNNTTFKTTLSRGDLANSITIAYVSLYRSTAAITSATLSANVGSFDTGSTFNLYGIANASITNVAKATGGDSVYTDGTYWYHIFRSSGIFTPTQALTADYLVVAGGGGGAGTGNADTGAGGGGAGGLRSTVTATGGGGSVESALSLSAQAYTVTVGAGGAGAVGGAGGFATSSATNGSNSVFSTITSTGGGCGGRWGINSPGNGGSGGGGTYLNNGGTGTANQGYRGGNPDSGTNQPAGGGGGAGAQGQDQSSGNTGGNGGAGVAVSITGSSVTYAGGGGGNSISTSSAGTGGSGGGGNAGAAGDTAGNSGTTNTGSGGGAGKNSSTTTQTGGNGGSGIVIVRYAA